MGSESDNSMASDWLYTDSGLGQLYTKSGLRQLCGLRQFYTEFSFSQLCLEVGLDDFNLGVDSCILNRSQKTSVQRWVQTDLCQSVRRVQKHFLVSSILFYPNFCRTLETNRVQQWESPPSNYSSRSRIWIQSNFSATFLIDFRNEWAVHGQGDADSNHHCRNHETKMSYFPGYRRSDPRHSYFVSRLDHMIRA